MKVLYINYGFNLNGSVNVNRVYEIIKYLSKKDVKIIHLTPSKAFEIPGVVNLIVSPSNNNPGIIATCCQFIKYKFVYSDTLQQENWVKDATKYLENNKNKIGKVDLIYINTSPYSLCGVGEFIKTLFNAKLVVDFQDPFYFFPYKNTLGFLDFLTKQKEKKYLQGVDLLIVNTPSAEVIYQKNYPNLLVKCVTNMIPSNLPQPISRKRLSSLRLISYGGSLYIGRDLFPVLKVLEKVKEKFNVEVVGNFTLINKLRYLKYSNLIWRNKMARDKYYTYLNYDVDVAVILQNLAVSNNCVQCVAAKTYECLALNKPIIYIGPEGDNAKIVRKYSLNYCVITSTDKLSDLAAFLNNFKQQVNNTRQSFYKDYSVDYLCAKLYKYLQSVMEMNDEKN